MRILTWKDLPDLRRSGRRRTAPPVEERLPPSAVLLARGDGLGSGERPEVEPAFHHPPERAGGALDPFLVEARAMPELALLWSLL